MRVVLAPDGFGGTLSPAQAASAMAEGVAEGAPAAQVRAVPLSDGGPGLLEVLETVLPDSRTVPARVRGPRGAPTGAQVLLAGPAGRVTAYVESALACGLHLLQEDQRDPRLTTTYGVGELLRTALDAGASRVVVGLGGSATDDGGAGMLSALGLQRVAGDRLEGSMDPRLAGVELVAATDVDAPLLGPRGASYVFGPQKGARPEDLAELDAAKARWADALEGHLGVAVRDRPGAGAAGGLGFALLALGGRREPGLRLVSQVARLDAALDEADLVLTGEGRLDGTSVTGKVVSGVAAAAAERGIPCVVLAGQVVLGRREQAAAGIAAAYALADAVGLETALAHPGESLARLAAQVAREWAR